MELRSGTIKGGGGGGGGGQEQQHLAEEACAMFQQGVGLVLARWTALQLAIHNEWGGPSSQLKAQQLHHDIFHWMLNSKAPRYIDELEDLLDENLVQQFNTETEDGSLEEVAEKLMSIYEECLEGKFETIRELASNNFVASQSTSKSQQVEADNAEENTNPTTATTNNDVDSMDLEHHSMDVDDARHDIGSQAIRDLGNRPDSLSLEEEADGWQLVSSKTKRKPRKF